MASLDKFGQVWLYVRFKGETEISLFHVKAFCNHLAPASLRFFHIISSERNPLCDHVARENIDILTFKKPLSLQSDLLFASLPLSKSKNLKPKQSKSKMKLPIAVIL